MSAVGVQYLKGVKNAPNAYDHIASTILKVLSENPVGSHELYEHLSLKVKDGVIVEDGLSLEQKLAKYLEIAAPTDAQKNDSVRFYDLV